MSLKKNREKIEEIDRKIIKLLHQRQEVIGEIAKIKQKNNQPIKDEQREKQVISRVTDLAAEEKMNTSCIKEIYQKILEMSREKQQTQVGEANNLP